MKEGRPLKFTKEQLESLIDDYFKSIINDDGTYKEPPTVCGLALACGTTRKTILDYELKGEFSDTIKAAKMRVEKYLEIHLYGSSVAGGIFNLKNNFGWVDKTEQAVYTPDGESFNVRNLSNEDLEAEIAKYE